MQTLYLVDNMKKMKESKKTGQTAAQQVKDTSPDDSGKLERASHDESEARAELATEANAPLTLMDMERLLTSMEERIIAKLSAQISADRAIINQHQEAIQQLETAANDTQERMEKLESTCAALLESNEELKAKLDDLENRSRRNNIRIIGLPENIEGPQPTAFIDTLLREIFGADAFPTSAIADRAHRIATANKKATPPRPRPLIVRIHHFQTKERILKLAREAGSVSFRGSKIYFFPDFSAETSKKRTAFIPVKSQLKNYGLSYRMLFPATLLVTDKEGLRHTFLSPEEATRFVKRLAGKPGAGDSSTE